MKDVVRKVLGVRFCRVFGYCKYFGLVYFEGSGK